MRRPRYAGKNPRRFDEKYKELSPERYAAEVEKVLASGKTPAGTHRPIMVDEVVACLRPVAGDRAIDCTLGGGGHAQAILERVRPGGRLLGLDVDPLELPRAEARLRAAGFGEDIFIARQGNFAGLLRVLANERIESADIVFADLGVSSMQIDNPARGFSYKEPGPLDMRMNPSRGEPASTLLERISRETLAEILSEHADEPHAVFIASLLKDKPLNTTHAVERVVRTGLARAFPRLEKAEVKMSVRRTFQALRIAVNDEFTALDALLRSLPLCLASGGRAAIITFHSGEDRRVKKAFQTGLRGAVYSDIAREVVRSTKGETFSNRRAAAAKLRWAVRA
ncbi:MAG TPA: 16S rRNA (cytosine(1402)-N(4))-methyltransferase RsmH [Vicinamibacterales bacterium]|jgi:16S rRNA (cytosine1402-N4)-methyltransferase|nr:16S rRNA (cytosine(1402)-N(4))-methyltransferase RsmH [Vicinamibacterales bacterium]